MQDKFSAEQGTNLYTIVSLLVENRIFLRSGVTSPRYIHHNHVNPWLIHSCKISRLEQEAMGPFKDSIYATISQSNIANMNVDIDVKHEKHIDKKRNITTLNLLIITLNLLNYKADQVTSPI